MNALKYQQGILKMNYSKGKPKNNNAPQPVKKQRPKPEWTTDFVDRQQFKLSQVEMIQKKASLQSKHRQQAKKELQQRRKKLQMGILDEDTRKVYETALISKNIDINPPLRRNLTEMIRYQKQQKDKITSEEYEDQYEGSDNQEDFDDQQMSEKQIKEAQNFIRKFERAKKQDKIERAVQILTNNSGLTQKEKKISQKTQNQPKVNNYLDRSNEVSNNNSRKSTSRQKASQNSQSFNKPNPLASIEDTIRFMEQKLFAAKKTVEQHSKSFISEADESFHKETTYQSFKPQFKETKMSGEKAFKKAVRIQPDLELNFKTKYKILDDEELQFNDKLAQISQLRIQLKDQDVDSQDDECLDTIRRMRQMMENSHEDYQDQYSKKLKENAKKNNLTPSIGTLECNSTIFKNSGNSHLDSEAQVSFNLTMNNDDQYQNENSQLNFSKSKIKTFEPNFSKKGNGISQNSKFTKFESKLSKQEEYEDEYQKIKQNLFSCINSNVEDNTPSYQQKGESLSQRSKQFTKFDQDEDSEDSLMVRDKINMWKKQFEHQEEPDEQEDQQASDLYFKTTAISSNQGKKPIFGSGVQNLVKRQDQDEEEQQDSEMYYRENCFNTKNQNKNSMNNNKSSETGFQDSNKDSMKGIINVMKKPPVAKKPQQSQKFEEMKRMISTASSQIQKIQIQPLKIQPLGSSGQVMGFDFRGSINIKKNVLSK